MKEDSRRKGKGDLGVISSGNVTGGYWQCRNSIERISFTSYRN